MSHWNEPELAARVRPGSCRTCPHYRLLEERLEEIRASVSGIAQRDRPPVSEARVRSMLSSRARRRDMFNPRLFSDPAWDILLNLYAHHLGQTRVALSTLATDCRVPATTALRWLQVLGDEGLVYREPDPLDARRVFTGLSPAGADAMEGYFLSLPNLDLI